MESLLVALVLIGAIFLINGFVIPPLRRRALEKDVASWGVVSPGAKPDKIGRFLVTTVVSAVFVTALICAVYAAFVR